MQIADLPFEVELLALFKTLPKSTYETQLFRVKGKYAKKLTQWVGFKSYAGLETRIFKGSSSLESRDRVCGKEYETLREVLINKVDDEINEDGLIIATGVKNKFSESISDKQSMCNECTIKSSKDLIKTNLRCVFPEMSVNNVR